jgi:hypothetical protein
MSETEASAIKIDVTEQHYPRYDAAHGTPDPMVRRLATLTLPVGAARFEQTDYGHPGRFNAWEPRGIDTALLSRTDLLRAVCDAISPLFG